MLRRPLVRIIAFCVATFALAAPSGVHAQKRFAFSPDAEKRFTEALSSFTKARYREADSLFGALKGMRPPHQRTTSSWVMEAKSLYHLGRYSQSVTLLLDFLREFPGSAYVDDVYYSLGLDYFFEARYEESARQFLQVLDRSADPALLSKSAGLFDTIGGAYLKAADLHRMLATAEKQEVKDLINFRIARNEIASGNPGAARELLDRLAAPGSKSTFAVRARTELDRLDKGGGVIIGVVLPLYRRSAQNPAGVLASEVLDGIEFALAEYTAAHRSSTPVTIALRDIERDTTLARSAVSDLASLRGCIGIVGPLFSNVMASCAYPANAARLPIISPTATGNGLASIGPYVFQANPDYETRGRAIARYAIRQMGMTRIGVLSSDEPAESLTVLGFADESRRLGAEIVASASYGKGQTDLREQFMTLRRWGGDASVLLSFADRQFSAADLESMKLAGADPALLDSVSRSRGTVAVSKLFGPRGMRVADSLGLTTTLPELATETLDTPVTNIQAIFAAIGGADEIGVIGSQLTYFNIRSQLLGNDEWFDPAQLEIHRRYVNNVVFTADSWLDPSDSSAVRFDRSFVAATTRHPTKYTVFGYDTMAMILGEIARGATTREKLARALSGVRGYTGVHAAIALDRDRVNSVVHIMKYTDGSVVKISDESVR